MSTVQQVSRRRRAKKFVLARIALWSDPDTHVDGVDKDRKLAQAQAELANIESKSEKT